MTSEGTRETRALGKRSGLGGSPSGGEGGSGAKMMGVGVSLPATQLEGEAGGTPVDCEEACPPALDL